MIGQHVHEDLPEDASEDDPAASEIARLSREHAELEAQIHDLQRQRARVDQQLKAAQRKLSRRLGGRE